MSKKYKQLVNLWFGFICSTGVSTLVHAEDTPQGSAIPRQVVALLAANQLVALGDIHGSERPVNMLISLLETSEVAQQIDDIVVEFGNSQYQRMADEYILNGRNIAISERQKIWRNTLYFMAWQTLQYARLMTYLHEYNQQHQKKIRLVLAEPAFNWQLITSEQWQQLASNREADYVTRIEQQVLEKNRKGILLFGTFHQIKKPVALAPQQREFTSLVARLAAKGIQIATIWPHIGPALTQDYRVPTLIDLQSDPMGKQPIDQLSARFTSQLPFHTIADYYLYSGAESREAQPAENNIDDLAWRAEMKRRGDMLGGRVQSQVNAWLAAHPVSR